MDTHTGLLPSALANTENKMNESYEKEETRTLWPVVLRSRNEHGLGVNRDTGPTSGVGVQTGSPARQRGGTELRTLLPPAGRHWALPENKGGSDEQTFLTECASVKTKIHDKLLFAGALTVWASCLSSDFANHFEFKFYIGRSAPGASLSILGLLIELCLD